MPKPSDATIRARVLALLRSGEATPAEAARLAGVSRQLVHTWCEAERIDWRAAYEWRLQMAWEKASQPQGLRKSKRPSKLELRAQADQAAREWASGMNRGIDAD